MDSRVDFALDRGRLLAPNLPPGSGLGPMTSFGNDLSRAGVAELARTATPATMTSLAQYQSRFLPSTMSMHSPGASFALMGGFLGGAAPADNLKTLMPDMQQFWTPHSDGYPRFVINNTPYTPFAPFLPTAADTLPSLLPPGPSATSGAGPPHCHRIYELQKDAFLASVAASQAGLYGIVPSGHPYLERVPSPLQQPQVQVPALPLGAVKQEPRESTSSCQGVIGERASSKSSERRHLTPSTPRAAAAAADPGRREPPPKESSLTSAHISNNNNNSIVINNNNNSSCNNSGGSRSQSVQRAPGSRSQGKPVEKKDVLKGAAGHEHVPGKDRRPEAAVKPADKRSDPVLDRPRAAPGSGLVIKSDSGKGPGVSVSLKSPKAGHATTKSVSSAPQPKVPCSKDSLAVAGSKTVATSKKIAPNSRDSGGALPNGAGKPNGTEKDGGERKASLPSVKASDKREELPTTTPSSAAVGDPGAKTHKKRPRDRSDHVKDGGGGASAMEKRAHPPPGVSAGSDARCRATVSPAASTCSLTPKSTSAPAAATGAAVTGCGGALNGSSPRAVPTLATVTSTSCDVSAVTSVPVTSGGTHSVYARSQPVTSTAVSASAASPIPAKSKSVTSQVATSALPYYHTLYSKSEGGEEGRVSVKRVHATTTFVPEVGTFKGPLIRNMPKGCPDGRAIKSEQQQQQQQQPRAASCRLEEEDESSKARGTPSSGVGAGDAEGGHGDGSEDEASDLYLPSSQRPGLQQHHFQSHRGGRLPHEDSHHRVHERPGERGGSTPTVAGEVCSSGRSSVPFAGSRAPSVGFLESGDSPDVALDFSMSKRAKEFTDARKCHEDRQVKASDRSPGSVSAGGKGLKYVSGRALSGTATSTSSCVPNLCSPVQRTEPREAVGPGSLPSSAASSLQATHVPFSGYSTTRQGPATHPPMAPTTESEHTALNLCKAVTKKKPIPDAASASKKMSATGSSDQPISVEMSLHVTGSGSRVSQLISKEKRCGSAPPHSSLSGARGQRDGEEEREEEEEEEEENTESSLGTEEKESTEHIASNIPVGIAVAQQRADGGRVDVRAGASRGEHHLRTGEDPETSRQLAHDFNEREEYLRQQKSVLTGAAKPIPNTALPPNLVVTGGENSLTEDLRLRPLANQWLAAGHGIAASPWLPQNPFALHPAIPTSNAAFDPNHHPGVPIPGGFKLAQDSLTGQLLIIPSGDLVDQNSLWSAFQSGAGSQPIQSAFPPLAVPLSQHAAVSAATSVPATTDNDGHAQTEGCNNVSHSVETNSECEEENSDGQQTPEQAAYNKEKPAAVTTAVTINNNNVTESREKGDAVNLNSSFVPADLTAHSLALQAAAAAAGINTPQFPFVFNPALLPLPTGLPVAEPVSIKTEAPSVQSRGCSPIIMSSSPAMEAADKAAPLAAGGQKLVSTACASVQTESDLDPKLDPVTATRKSTSAKKEQGIQTSLGEHLQPLSVICGTSDYPLPHHPRDSAPLGALAAAALAAEANLDALTTQGRSSRAVGVSYNPFTDPQILQAADGLELLSTLAEKRPKCSSAALVDPKAVFPSPSDSFKSDTPLPCPELEEASSLGEGERSGGTTPRGDRPRDVSPKWGPPSRKDGGQAVGAPDFKLSSSLANMDAIELDMRIRLAELQRQYREKQRELAKLQPKKDKEDGTKRGRGRPRKRQFVTGKKYDDESSNSSGGKTTKEGCVKRRRPAEELVDRVFRKLPPAKLGKLKMKSISFKHKRRSSHSASSADANGTKESGKKKDKHRHDTGNLFSNLESSFGDSSSKKKVKRESEIPATVTSALPHTPTTITPVTLESGLGLLAKFATSALSSTSSTTFSGTKRKSDDSSRDAGLGDTHSFGTSPGHSPLDKRRESDTDNSDTANGTCIKKRKPGRPRKCDPNKTTGFTETIWARQTGLLQLSDVAQGKTWVSKAEEAATTSTTTTSTASSSSSSSSSGKLAGNGQAPLAPLLLDEWSLRRSERIFLSDTSPLPSPNLQPAKDSAARAPAPRDSRCNSTGPGRPAGGGGRGRPPGTGYKQRQRANSLNAEKLRQRSHSEGAGTAVAAAGGGGGVKVQVEDAGEAATSASGCRSGEAGAPVSEEKKDKDHAKVQKARSLQELTQRVKRKYNKNLCKKPGPQEEKRKRTPREETPTVSAEEQTGGKEEESDSSSEADNMPLSSLRERPVTPEPRSCIIRQEELQDGLHVLFFRDCLFYEGVVQAIQAPDIYGVVVTGQRGTRPHICSREEILKDAIMAVEPGSQRYVSEGTRVCAYWSQQFRCLYPGTVAKTSPNPHAASSVNVEFDDGDSGRIPLNHIRLLPPDFPLVTEEPDPLQFPTKRRRRTMSEDDLRRSTDNLSPLSGSGPGRRNARAHTLDGNRSDDGSVFDTVSHKSSASGKSSGRTRSCKDDMSLKSRAPQAKGKETRSATGLKARGALSVKRSTKRGVEESKSESDEDDSEDEDPSSEEGSDSSSSEDEKKERKSGGSRSKAPSKDESGKKSKRGKTKKTKKKERRVGGSSSRLTWRWDGRSTKRPGMRGKAKKEFYKSIARGSAHLSVGDSAVFVSTGRDHCPYIGRIESLWESWGGQMMVKVKWFYHPQETKGCKQLLAHPKGALFESPHSDENDVQTISHKCHVLSFKEYNRRTADAARKGQPLDVNTYYLAGYYDPTIGSMKLEPDVQ